MCLVLLSNCIKFKINLTLNIEILYLYDMNIQKHNPGTQINANDKYPQMGSSSKQTYA